MIAKLHRWGVGRDFARATPASVPEDDVPEMSGLRWPGVGAERVALPGCPGGSHVQAAPHDD